MHCIAIRDATTVESWIETETKVNVDPGVVLREGEILISHTTIGGIAWHHLLISVG